VLAFNGSPVMANAMTAAGAQVVPALIHQTTEGVATSPDSRDVVILTGSSTSDVYIIDVIISDCVPGQLWKSLPDNIALCKPV
jgi:hypothetical protein